MAIIDTSKGVRPVVEELARLENTTKLYNAIPAISYEKNPELYKPTRTLSSGAVLTNNEDGSFSISGNINSSVYTTTTEYITFDNFEI